MGNELVVEIVSFSYKKGVPLDATEHGGGFVFDCRCVDNPGRQQDLKDKTGLDKEVISFLKYRADATSFFGNVKGIVSQAVENYISRGHQHLFVCFGCTGGQHRSVYFAQSLANNLQNMDGVKVVVTHRDMPKN